MRLVILRHAEAHVGADNDSLRLLTPYGQAQSRAMRVQLESLLGDYRILSSPWERARTTAAALALSANLDTCEQLVPTGSTAAVAGVLEPFFTSERPLVVVTHQPLCGRLIHWLSDGSQQSLPIAPCGGALLELDWPAAGMGRLIRWLDATPSS